MNIIGDNNKGKYGYIDSRKKRLITLCIILAAVIIGITAAGLLIWGTTKNYLMIPALLTAIPFANLFASLMAYIKYKSPSGEQYAYLKHFDEADMLLSELMIVDDKGKRYFIDFAVIYKGGVAAYTSAVYDRSVPGYYINDVFKKRGIPMNIRIYDKWDEFTERLDSIEASEGDELRKCRLAYEALLSISM